MNGSDKFEIRTLLPEKKDILVAAAIIVLVFLFLIFTRTLNSGFHFIDDHEIIRIKSDLGTSSFVGVCEKWGHEDIHVNGRFRPFYIIFRVAETKLFGSDFLLWSVYTGAAWCAALILLYSAMRKMKFAVAEAIIFLFVAFIGPQSCVWWRLGPGESLGTLLLAASFYFMASALTLKNYFLKNIFFVLCLILASLTKESFLIIIPAMVVFKIWNENTILFSSMNKSIKSNIILIVPLAIMILELVYIKYSVGIFFSGLDTVFKPGISSIISTFLHFIWTYINIVVAGILLVFSARYFKKIQFRFDLLAFVFFLMVLVPNLILYSKTGLVERYLLPSSLGLGFLVAAIIRDVKVDIPSAGRTVVTLILISFLPHFIGALKDAVSFSRDGYSTKELISEIAANKNIQAPLLLIADPKYHFEKSISLRTYLLYEDKTELYSCLINSENNLTDYQGYIDGLKSYFKGRGFENLTSKPGLLIFLDNKLISDFFQNADLSAANYSPIKMKSTMYALYKMNRQ